MQTAIKIRRRRGPSLSGGRTDCAGTVRAVLSIADEALDYARAKLAFDALIDPIPVAADMMAAIDRLAASALELAGPAATPGTRMAALCRLLYVAGPWNGDQPFAYDQTDPLGQRIAGKLLAHYLTTRRGNCVSMPALHLILAERLGLDVALARAPLHFFLRWRDECGRVVNLETTSGGHPARDEWYREQMPMSDRAVANGVYLRSLSKREGVAMLATTVLEHLVEQRRYREALPVSGVILNHAPRDVLTMVKQGTLCAELIRAEFTERYRFPALIPLPLRRRHEMLAKRNHDTFAAAEALGWEAVE